MKNRILTNSFRTIRRMFPRFIALLIISLLGSFSFIGLQSTAPNMLDTLDVYLDDNNVYDIRIISSYGLVDKDVEELENVEGVKNIEASYSKDILMQVNENEYVVNIESLPFDPLDQNNINKLDLIDGRFPISVSEIVVEENLLKKNNMEIGDTISFVDETFKENILTIVGSVNSHVYFNNVDLSQNRGATSIGAGTINYYAFVNKDAFNVDYYTSIYITLEGTKEEITSSKKYTEIVDNFIEKIDDLKEKRETERYNEVIDGEINKIKEKIDSQLSRLKTKIDNLKEYIDAEQLEINKLANEIEEIEQNIDDILNAYNLSIYTYEYRIIEIQNDLINLDPSSQEYIDLNKELNDLLLVNELSSELNAKITSYNLKNEIFEVEKTIYELNLDAYEQTEKRFEDEIQELRDKLNELPKAKWYVFDRSGNVTYTEYVEDTGSISSLAKIFPIIFFAVAILISLVSMNRMVEDDRNEIGTLKSMGFSNKHIIVKYLFFAILATLIGSTIGSISGAIIVPSIIYSIYSVLFTLRPIYLNAEVLYLVLGNTINFVCIIGTTYFTVIKVLKEKPSQLMRPKAPKNGKRVYLEKIKFIWNRLSFSSKVTVRNLFRYKRRAFVTILGVMGCTALMMCGFGVKDAIVDIPDRQFGKIFTFDAMVYVQNYNDEQDRYVFENEMITNTIQLQNINIEVGGRKATMFVVDKNDDVSEFINLYDYDDETQYNLEHNKIAITKKLAELEDIEIGDVLSFNDKNNVSYEYEVSAIVANYMEHYIFIDSGSYELNNQLFTPNTVCIQTLDLDDLSKENLTKSLLESNKVISISYVSELVEKVSNMIKTLDKVVYILIILASLLSFVVLYNLSSINIHERKREIATLKVLGFYHKEVDNYISKENIILTILGLILGLILGYFLAIFVIKTVELEKAKFMTDIKLMTFVYSGVLTIAFTIIVNFITHFMLKKINMIESLKSVE